jgi:hypothetical protein
MARTATTQLLPLWRTKIQPLLLYAAFYDRTPPTAATVASRYGVDRAVVSREARRLVEAGILRSRIAGRNKVLTIDDAHPAIQALRTLVDLTVGPLVDLRELYDVDGVDQVFIFGSWARRHLGEPGPPPNDVDVLIVGKPDGYDVNNVCLEVSGRHSIAINPLVISTREYANRADNPLLNDITDSPTIEVPR